jgi:PAS domain S-box-containing protein
MSGARTLDTIPTGALVDALPLVFLISRDGVFLDVHADDPAELLVGPDAFLGKHASEVLPPNVAGPLMAWLGSADIAPHTLEYALDVRGEPRHYLARLHPLDGDALIVVRDVTELVATRSRWENLVQGIDAIVWESSGRPLRPRFASKRAERILGYPLSRWQEPDFFRSIMHPDDAERVVAAVEALAESGGDQELEYRARAADGRMVWFHDAIRAVRGEDGAVALLRGVMVDVTQQKQAQLEREQIQAQLLHSQKLESMGLLAGGVAHDFNNLLTAIIANASLVQRSLPAASPLNHLVEQILVACDRGASLTRQILAYSGKGTFDVSRMSLPQHIREICHLVQAAIPSTVHLRLEVRDDLPTIEGDPAQIQQVFMNLAINGAEAMAGGGTGTLLITTGVMNIDEEYSRALFAAEQLAPGRYVYAEVHDTGMGMDEATKARIFDPFFTTKKTGRGLGLAAVLGIMRSHRGAIRVYSSPGKGTTFKVFFPAADGTPDLPQPGAIDEDLRGSGLVLVVDDEQIVREATRAGLATYGYDVIVAEHGLSALEIFRQLKDRVTIVVLDMTMPVMGGEETFQAMRQLDPAVTALLTSGFNEIEATRRFTTKGLAGFLQKPFTPDQLARKIRDLMRRAQR